MGVFTVEMFVWLFLAAAFAGLGWTLGCWLMARLLGALFK
jgi:hypothetical protein